MQLRPDWTSVLQELYDPKALAAVMSEWGRTIQDIPAFIQMSVEMGVYSSAQLMRFMTLDVRPNMTRSATRLLPQAVSSCSLGQLSCVAVRCRPSCLPLPSHSCQASVLTSRLSISGTWTHRAPVSSLAQSCTEHLGLLQAARGFVGRLMADPAFAQKLVIEGALAAGTSLYWEYRQRGDRFVKCAALFAGWQCGARQPVCLLCVSGHVSSLTGTQLGRLQHADLLHSQ